MIKLDGNKVFLCGYDGFIFDFDGVIAETETLKANAYYDAIKHFCGVEVNRFDMSWAGKKEDEIAAYFNDTYNLCIEVRDYCQLIEQKRLLYQRIIAEQEVCLVKNVECFLRRLKSMRKHIAVASMSTHREVEMILARKGITCLIDEIVCGEDVVKPKPDPEVYIAAIEKIRKSSGACVAFEDSAVGMQAAVSAGLETILVRHEYNQGFKDTEVCEIADFGDVIVE